MSDQSLADLARIERHSFEDADDIMAFLETVDGSEDLMARLCDWQFRQTHEDPQFDCKAIVSLQRRGYNVYRMYSLKMEWGRRHYRIVYAYQGDKDIFHVLAVVLKLTDRTPPGLRQEAYNYEPDHPLTQRICDVYESLGLPIRH